MALFAEHVCLILIKSSLHELLALFMLFAVAWHKRTEAEVLLCHGIRSDQCVKPIRLVSVSVSLLVSLI